MEATRDRRRDWLLWIACLLPFLGFWTYGLFDLDEGFYGAVVADMIRRGDWITPTLNGTPWFEKPILAYWLAIPAVRVFGESVGPRLPSVLCTLATVVVLYRFVRRHLGESVARWSALVYASNLLVVALGRMMMTDAPLVLCLTIAITRLGDWRLLSKSGSDTSDPGWGAWLVIGVAVGLGTLAKGPVALVLFGGVFILATLLIPEFRSAWKSAWPIGLIACAVVLASWYVPCYLQNGQAFIQKFLIEQNVGRFGGGDRAHTVPWWSHPVYFPVVLAASFLPWWFFGRPSVFAKWQREQSDLPPTSASLRLFLIVWLLVPLAFFTISGTKLPHYILPAVAPLAILFGATLALRPKQLETFGVAWCLIVAIAAQAVFWSDWNARMREVQTAAKWARHQPGGLFVYRIGREGPSSTGSLTLDETSHPSIQYYYGLGTGRLVAESDRVEDMPTEQSRIIVLTREGQWGRGETEWIHSHGLSARKLPREDEHNYEVWEVDKLSVPTQLRR